MKRLTRSLKRIACFNVDGLSCGGCVSLFIIFSFYILGTQVGNGQTTILEVNATSFQNVYTPVVGPRATFLTSDYLVFDSSDGLTCIGGTWRVGVRYSPIAFNGSELVAEVDYTPYGQTDGNLMTLVDPAGTEIRLEVIRRGRLGLRYGSQKAHTVVINWPVGYRTVRLIRTSNTMRLEFNGATWVTMTNLPSITTGNYQVKVGCLAANDPSAQGYFYHWRVISRTTPSTVLPLPDWGLSTTIASQLQALENRADALCVPEITGTPTQLTIKQLRSAAARVTLDSLWSRAYLGKTTAFDTMVSDLNTNVFDPLQYGTDNATVIPLAQINSTGDGGRWLIDDDGLYLGLVGWDVAPYIKDMAQLGHNLISTSVLPNYVFKSDGSTTMKFIEGEVLPILDLAERYGMKVDIMLSPYPPDYLVWAHPEWSSSDSTCGCGFLQACILDDDYRSMCQTYINRIVVRLKGHPALGSYCLGNEILFREYCDEAQSRFREYLQNAYSTIGALNSAWGSSYAGWSEIIMTQTMGTDKTNAARYWDWVDFNCELGTEYIGFLKNTIKAIDPVTPVHVKTLPWEFGLPNDSNDSSFNYANGVDLRTLHNNNDLIGTDSYSDYVGGFYDLACNPMWQLMCYDLLTSYDPSKPFFDSEWHIVNTTSWTSGTFLNAMMYLGMLHNLRAGTIWVCNPTVNTVDVISEGSTLYQAGLSAAKLRSLTSPIRSLAQRPKPIALLYSRVAKNVDGHSQFIHLRQIYEAGLYTGLGVTLLEERDLLDGNLHGARAIIASDCYHTLPGVGDALANFAASGGEVRCFGSVAVRDPDGTAQNSTLAKYDTGTGYGVARWQWPDENLGRWPGVNRTFTTAQDWSVYDTLTFQFAQQGTETGGCYFRYQNNGVWVAGANAVDYFTANGSSSYHTITVHLGTYTRDKVTAIQFYTYDGNFAGTGTRVWYLDNIKVRAALPGDANLDGAVNVSDLSLLAANYGVTIGATWAMGDFNKDGAVSVSDLSLLAANYGVGSTSTVSWDEAYAEAFGTSVDGADDETTIQDNDEKWGSGCSGLGIPLILGVSMFCLLLLSGSRIEER
jgi:hypothetical protein